MGQCDRAGYFSPLHLCAAEKPQSKEHHARICLIECVTEMKEAGSLKQWLYPDRTRGSKDVFRMSFHSPKRHRDICGTVLPV
ncbi:unnamed protein product [Ixodes persulcatus]